MNIKFSTDFTTKLKTKKALGLILCFLLTFNFVFFKSPIITKAAGATYYVSTNSGNNANAGTEAAPLKTIAEATNRMAAGDICILRGGTYRETIIPKSGTSATKTIYKAYSGETVTINATNYVNGWLREGTTNLYYKDIDLDASLGSESKVQVFRGSILMEEARWPDSASTDVATRLFTLPTMATADATTTYTKIVDAALPSNTTTDFTGATLTTASGLKWIAQTVTISSHSGQTLNFTPPSTDASYKMAENDTYYLSGKKNMLSQQTEWWYDSTTNRLYAYSTTAPPDYYYEAKVRQNVIDLTNVQYIEFDGINTKGGSIVTDSTTKYCTLKNMNISYVYHSDKHSEQTAVGIILAGEYNEIKNCELSYSSGSILSVSGKGNKIVNNYIHHGGYIPYWDGLVTLYGKDHLLINNTISDAGRCCVNIGNAGLSASNIEVAYNEIKNGMWLTDDGSLLNSGNTDGQFSNLHHNIIHDSKSPNESFGIYTDNYTHNFVIHHNVLYNTHGIRLNTPSEFNLVYNNTLYGKMIYAWGNTFEIDMQGTRVFNNITAGFDTSQKKPGMYAVHGNNIAGTSTMFETGTNNYKLLSTATDAINKGVVESGITDGYITTPDIGAYEYGGIDWTPSVGHNFSLSPTPTKTTINAAHQNKVKNGGFELGDRSSWSLAAGWVEITDQNHWGKSESDGITRSNQYGIKLGTSAGNTKLTQTVSGLTSGTTYSVSAWVKCETGSAKLGVEGFGGTTVSPVTATSTSWTRQTVYFKTGGTNTSAVIYLETPANSFAYFDDAAVQLYTDQKTAFEAESFDPNLSLGVTVVQYSPWLGSVNNGDYAGYAAVDIGPNINKFTIAYATDQVGSIEIRLDSITATPLGTIAYNNTGGWGLVNLAEKSLNFTLPAGFIPGHHKVYIKFVGGGANIDWFKFSYNN